MMITVLVRNNHIHVADMIGVKLAFTIIFLIRELAFLEMTKKSFVWHDVMRDEGTIYCLYLIVRHSILNDIIIKSNLFKAYSI